MSELAIDVKETPGLARTATVALAGTIDARTVISFKTQLESAKGRGVRTFLLDMEHVSYINSTGLSYLISLADTGDSSRPGLVLVKVQAKVKVLFDMMGLGSLFRFFYSLDEAVEALGGKPVKAAADSSEPPREKPPPAPIPIETSPPPAPSPAAPSLPSAAASAPPPVKAVTPAPIRIPTPPPAPPAAAPPAKAPPLPVVPVPGKPATPPPVRTATPVPMAASRMITDRSQPPTVRAIAEPLPVPGTRNEDWLAVALAFLLVGIVAAGLRPPMASFDWASDGDFFAAAARNKAAIDRLAEEATAKGDAELAAAVTALRRAFESGDRGKAAEAAGPLASAGLNSSHDDLRAEALRLDREVGSLAGATIGQVFSQRNALNSALLGIVTLILAGIAVSMMGGRLESFALGFPIVFALAWLSQMMAGNIPGGRFGLDSLLVSLLLGLLVGNALGVPAWLRESLRSEFYLKTGLVMMGAGLFIPRFLQSGVPAAVQGVLIVAIVGYAGFWISRLLRVDEDFSAVLSTSVAVGGMPAAIASLLSVRGDRRKLPYLTALTFIVSVPLVFLLPWLIRELNLSKDMALAWLGGTIDTRSSASFAGSRIGDSMARSASFLKDSQELLLLPAALLLAIVWAFRHGARLRGRASAGLLWQLFPKPALALLAVSIAFSFLIPPPQAEASQGILRGLRETWFTLAFLSIGMETRFTDLVRLERGRPAAAFLLVQILNALVALLLAWFLFGGILLGPDRPG